MTDLAIHESGAHHVRFSRADLLACSGHKNRDRLSAFGLFFFPTLGWRHERQPIFLRASRLRCGTKGTVTLKNMPSGWHGGPPEALQPPDAQRKVRSV